MSLPALQHLRVAYPDAKISVLARPWVAAIYAGEPFCDELIPYETSSGWHGIIDKAKAAKHLRPYGFDCAVLLQNAFEAAALAWCARIPDRIGYNRDARGWLLTRAVPVPREGEIPKHQRFYYLELLKRAGLIPCYDSTAAIRLERASLAAEAGRSRLADLFQAASAIGVCPGAAYGGAKRWLPERFAEAAVLVARELNAGVLVTGAASELSICQQVHQQVSGHGVECVNLAGKTKLSEFIELAAACRIILTNDSGSMHLGYALGVPTVTVFGPTDDEVTGPIGALCRIVRQPVECSPCLLRECPIDHRCMTRVDALRVARTALEVVHGG